MRQIKSPIITHSHILSMQIQIPRAIRSLHICVPCRLCEIVYKTWATVRERERERELAVMRFQVTFQTSSSAHNADRFDVIFGADSQLWNFKSGSFNFTLFNVISFWRDLLFFFFLRRFAKTFQEFNSRRVFILLFFFLFISMCTRTLKAIANDIV